MNRYLRSLGREVDETVTIGLVTFVCVVVLETFGVALGMIDLTKQWVGALALLAILGLPLGVPTFLLFLKNISQNRQVQRRAYY